MLAPSWPNLVYINFQQNFPYFSSYDNFYCIEICLPTAYSTSSRCVLKRGFPKFGLCFSKHPTGFHCHKRPSPTFANIWSHCPWVLQSVAPVIFFSFQLPIGLPPILPDLREELEEKFLNCVEDIPIHDLDNVQK